MRYTTSRLPYAFWIFLFMNCSFTLYGILIKTRHHTPKIWAGEEYPFEIPQNFDTVAMTLIANTTRFAIEMDNEEASAEWNTLSDRPFVVHLGEDHRIFNVAVFHQIHCIHVMEETFLRGQFHRLNHHHIIHCQNYLRQSFLCAADDDLERGDFEHPNGDWIAGEKVCRDWEQVSQAIRTSLDGWLKLEKELHLKDMPS